MVMAPHIWQRAMSALQRHQHQVKYILNRRCVAVADVESGRAQSSFSCVSVKHPKTSKYAGCISELRCEYPQCRYDECKHLEAAAQVLPFTHAMRLKAAEAPVDHVHALELEKGVQCRRLCGTETPDCILNVSTWFCTCLYAKLHQTCAHLLAAQQHSEFNEACSLAAFNAPMPEDPLQVIMIERRPLLSMALDVEEPVKQFGGGG
eukprot:TRINITY_DN352_c1_g1_i3.p1 TRINITY_DN352_c1_g1~~TRINITY_DN352_c1_g1_i3.p1  ORF type:complete len:206 (-),score=33.56 TRINITY_DN352_c1_g1_i3:161-778(-)